MRFAVPSLPVRLEQLRAIVSNMLSTVVATAFASIALAWLLRDYVPATRSLPWIIALNVVGMVRLGVVLVHRRRPAEDPAQAPLLAWVTGCAIVSGLLWAATPWVLYVPREMHLQAATLFACLAVGTGGAFGTVARRSTAFAIFIPPALAPAVFALFEPGHYYAVLGVMAAVYAAIVSRIILVLHHQIRHQIELRFEKFELMDDLRKRTAEAEAANTAKSEFLAAASHDLRQPMHAIALHVKTLSGQPLPSEARQLVHRLTTSVDAMEGLFSALLDMSRLDAGAVTPDVQGFPLDELLRRMLDEFDPLADEKGLKLRIRPSSLWIASDRMLLDRVLRNLLSNAIRYTERGGVLVAARQRDWRVWLEVWDTGLGIPANEQRAVFREFHQLHNPARDRRRGLGLGLAIVDRITRLLGHPVELRSRQGRGTLVRVEVPRATPRSGKVAVIAPPSAEGLRTSAPLVVFVEDDVDVLDATVTLLRHWGCEVIAGADSASVAIQLSQWGQLPDLIVCDYRLAEQRNGVDVVQWLRRKLGAAVPAVIVTGDTSSKPLEEAGSLDIEVLRKPVLPDRLKQVVFAALSRTPQRELVG